MNINKILAIGAVIFCFYISSPAFAFSPNIYNAIYNGNKVTSDAQFPFVVAIYHTSKDQVACTASIIGKNWVLTAKHCVETTARIGDALHSTMIPPDTLLVGTGYLAGHQSKAEQLLHVKKIFVFGDTDPDNLEHDIALLQLTDTTDIQPVALPSYNDFPNLKTSHLSATAVGYGYIQELKPDDPSYAMPSNTNENDTYYDFFGISKFRYDWYLHYGDEIIQDDQTVETVRAEMIVEMDKSFPVTVDDDMRRRTENKTGYFNPTTMLGATSPDGKVTTQGDSGGPLLLTVTQKDNSQQYVQVGVTTGGMKDPITLFVNLTDRNTLDFINNTMKNNP